MFALTRADDPPLVWAAMGAELRASRYRPPLHEFDVLIVPGLGTWALCRDPGLIAYLASYPENRLVASVCTGALLLGAAGRLRGKPATTHASALDQLGEWGATARTERVVDAGQVVTAGG
ncbi:MAG: DJ-1/PfpI family protein [Polyangiaceae bacterium]